VNELGSLTSPELGALAARSPSCVLLPVGSVEPHGPHLPLTTDTIISHTAATRALGALQARGIAAVVAPPVHYGVTDFAAGFPGAVGVPAAALTAFLKAVIEAYLASGFDHVCVVNNHLEPAHDAAVRDAVKDAPRASVACPLTRRWGRLLSGEFKKGQCHAGTYETSLVMASGADVRAKYKDLAEVPVSLSDGIRAGQHTFREMGMNDAYAGAPAAASAAHGDEQYAHLVEMVVTEVVEGLARSGHGNF